MTFLDKNKGYPKMKVYVHPNEMSGWAPKKEIDKLLEIFDVIATVFLGKRLQYIKEFLEKIVTMICL